MFEPSDSYKKDFYLKNGVIKGDTIIKDVKRTVKVFNTSNKIKNPEIPNYSPNERFYAKNQCSSFNRYCKTSESLKYSRNKTKG